MNLEVPTLPEGSLQGPIFLGQAGRRSRTDPGPPYTIYLDAESSRYGLRVLPEEATVINPTETVTGTADGDVQRKPAGAVRQAMPCTSTAARSRRSPTRSCAETARRRRPFTAVLGGRTLLGEASFDNDRLRILAGPRSTGRRARRTSPTAGGRQSNFTFNLSTARRPAVPREHQDVLPAGVVGKIPTVTQCTEAQAKADEAQNVAAGCPIASRVGTATAAAGSGTPFPFTGTVYLTAPCRKGRPTAS